MEDTLKAILENALSGVNNIQSRPEFDAFKATLVGPNGSLTLCLKQIGTLPREERPIFGKRINEVKREIETNFSGALRRIENSEMAARLGPPIDPTLPGVDGHRGSQHLLNQVLEEICNIFRRIGFVVAEGSEVETEFFCFDALNTPPDSPARDLQDTYYLPSTASFGNVGKKDRERYLLRTHTSTVQIREMLKQDPPLRILSPGRCFRRDTADATHSANFHQFEGLFVAKNVTVKDLKAVLDYFSRALLGPDAKTRFRPHFFPFTEPSFEMDFSSAHLTKVGREWTEMGGCGMVDPAVFEAVGYDPEEWSGYAFGFGLERIAMILYGIDDIRYFYQNDLRFLRQFA